MLTCKNGVKNMVILHICSINNKPFSGISKVVPEHYIHQLQFADVAILNCSKEKIEKLQNYKTYYNLREIHSISALPNPYNKPDLVVFHGVYFLAYYIISRYLKRHKIPYIIIPHGSLTVAAQNIKIFKKKIANLIFFNSFIKSAVSIQFLSSVEKQSSIFNQKSFVMGNGIEIPKQKKKSFNTDCLRLIYIGRYDIFTKGIDLIVKMVRQNAKFLIDNHVDVDMYGTAGADGIIKVKELVTNNGVDDIIKVHDALFGEDKAKEMLNHDMFIQLSRHEGQPLGIMEAMSYGLPIIVSKETSFGEAVYDNMMGIYYKSDCITKELNKLITNSTLLKQMGNNSYNYIKNNYEWERIAKETVKIYGKIKHK